MTAEKPVSRRRLRSASVTTMSWRPANITQVDIAHAIRAADQAITNRHVGMCLYVIGPKGGPVKIGISGSAHARVEQLQTGHPFELAVLAEVAVPDDGCKSEESIHKFLAPYRTRPNGEWFHRTSEVSRLIEMAYCRLSPDLMMEKLRTARQENWQRNRAAYQRRRRDEMAV
jgi:hypothetical protein